MQQPVEILRKYWGHDAFRPLQAEIIQNVLAGNDTLALLPTGGGKSVCFQVPALIKGGICIVISPLIALINDQVEALKRKGIAAYAVHSGLYPFQVRDMLKHLAVTGEGFLYVAPERLNTPAFRIFLENVTPSLVAVDEAHCISQWGYDFRPAYLNINQIRSYAPDTPVIALTASATRKVQEDICEKLSLDKPQIFRQSFERPNLSYAVHFAESRHAALIKMVKEKEGCGIVYCRVRNQTRQLAELLLAEGISADFYHAGLSAAERNKKQALWIEDKIRVIVCTNAFGMGIDKPDVRFVIHAESPDCLENYYQEAGRAGRDGKPAAAELIFCTDDWKKKAEKLQLKFPPYEVLKELYFLVMDHLRVAAGGGENEVFNWDMQRFLSNYNLNALAVYNGMVALEKCGIWQLNDAYHKPSVAVFTCSREDLASYAQQYPQHGEIATGLLRAYEGIFNSPAPIREDKFAAFLNLPETEVKETLLVLHNAGIIEYHAQKNEPAIVLLLNRMYADAFRIDTSLLEQLKETYLQREKAMKDYLSDNNTCRSRFIAAYFDNPIEKDCGICDNCQRKATSFFPATLAGVAEMVMNKLDVTKPVSLQEIKTWGNVEQILHAIRYLQNENRIKSNEKGEITKVR